MGVQKTPPQKSYELYVRAQNFTVDFMGANRQFDWVEILLVYDKIGMHYTVSDSYKVDLATTNLKTIPPEKIGNTYSISNTLKYDVNNPSEKYELFR